MSPFHELFKRVRKYAIQRATVASGRYTVVEARGVLYSRVETFDETTGEMLDGFAVFPPSKSRDAKAYRVRFEPFDPDRVDALPVEVDDRIDPALAEKLRTIELKGVLARLRARLRFKPIEDDSRILVMATITVSDVRTGKLTPVMAKERVNAQFSAKTITRIAYECFERLLHHDLKEGLFFEGAHLHDPRPDQRNRVAR